ncbi:cation:proton antiporter [Aciditerrimonas ferrireducens]|uniref:Cation:proton antiporter n=1 Tax=Aciditerrimonas ferrireducens TaxID=667306 RepID=A0ABV6C3H9_9ACTN
MSTASNTVLATVLLPPVPGERLVVFFTQLAALLGAARLLGAGARRLRLPPVVGELLAGLVLGPSVLGLLWPAAGRWVLPTSPAGSDLLQAVAEVALLVLLVAVGSETDLALIRSLGPGALAVAASSLIVPLAAGLVVAVLLTPTLRAPGGSPVAFDLLLAGALGVSSLPVVAKILGDLRLLRRSFAQLALAAGTANDVTAFLLATVATGLTRHGGQAHADPAARLALALGGLVVLSLLLFSVGQRLLDHALREVRRSGPNLEGALGVALVAALSAAALTQALGIEGALGGFLVGVALGRSRFQQPAATEELERLTSAVFAPLFFATAGLRVDLRDLATPRLATALLAMVLAALASKLLAGWLGAWLSRRSLREGTALGVVLNGRGTLQVILAGAGLTAHVFTPAAYSAVIVLALISSLPLAPALQALVARWPGSPDERARLADEARFATNQLVRPGRLLLASDGNPDATLAATVLHQAWPTDQPVTVLTADPGVPRPTPLRTATWPFPGRPVERRAVATDRVADAVLAEARLGYAVVGLGAPPHPPTDHVFGVQTDAVVAATPVPVVVARRARQRRRGRGPRSGHALPEDLRFERILVPVSGSRAARAALELAAGVAAAQRATVLLAHVAPPRRGSSSSRALAPEGPAERAGQAVLREAERLARQVGLRPQVLGRRSDAPAQALARLAAEVDADLVVLGVTSRQAEGRLALGSTVPSLLERLEMAVVAVVLPQAPSAEPPTPPPEPPPGAPKTPDDP